MKKGTLILVLALALVGLTGRAWAATTDTITVTVSMESIVSVSVSPDTWTIGSIGEGGTAGPEAVVATNNGNVTEDFAIRATNGANGWTLGATAGTDVFVVTTNHPLTLTTSDQTCATNVSPLGTDSFNLNYAAPTTDAQGGGLDQSFTITVTASASP
jgi:hypothetical protein